MIVQLMLFSIVDLDVVYYWQDEMFLDNYLNLILRFIIMKIIKKFCMN